MLSAPTFAIYPLSCGCPSMSIACFHNCEMQETWNHTFQSFSYAECGFPHSGYRSGSLALYLIHEFLFLNFQIHRISTLSFRLLSIDKSDNMLHSPSGFPSRISCRIIGCDFSSLDTFTYCLLKAVFHKYHAAEFIMRWRLLGARNSPKWFLRHLYKSFLTGSGIAR